MEKEFVPYKLALRMKALGFNEKCIMHWWKGKLSYYQMGDFSPTHTSAPTSSQTFRWFREKYNLHQSIIKYSGSKIYWCQIEMISDKKDKSGEYEVIYATSLSTFTKYQDAELACLDKLLEIVEGIESQK